MEGKAIITVISLALLAHSVLSIDWIWGRNEEYNLLCSQQNETYTTIPLPGDRCDLRSFIMCTERKGIAVDQCRGEQRFNSKKRWCDEPDKVPLPEGCKNETKVTVSLTCDDDTKSIPVNGTCKEYIHCVRGIEHKRPCPILSFYIPELGVCEYITEPFVRNIPPAALVKCIQLDPYKKEEFGTTT